MQYVNRQHVMEVKIELGQCGREGILCGRSNFDLMDEKTPLTSTGVSEYSLSGAITLSEVTGRLLLCKVWTAFLTLLRRFLSSTRLLVSRAFISRRRATA